MLKLRYYCQGQGKEEIRKLLTNIEAKHGITYETRKFLVIFHVMKAILKLVAKEFYP